MACPIDNYQTDGTLKITVNGFEADFCSESCMFAFIEEVMSLEREVKSEFGSQEEAQVQPEFG